MPVTKIIGLPWSLSGVWNECLDSRNDRPLLPRQHIYASEMGGSFCDRYLKMYGVPMSNPPNKRSKRKFTAGDSWEWLVGLVLMASGILKKKQIKVDIQAKGLLSVHGRLDFIAGGAFDYDSAMRQVELVSDALSAVKIDIPPFFIEAAERFVKKHKGQVLEDVVYEAKSISSYMINKVQKTGAMDHHVLQCLHYISGNDIGIRKGKVGYVCKDDCIMEEFNVEATKELVKKYVDDVKKMTSFYSVGFNKRNPMSLMPPKEPEVLFEEGVWRFVKNWKVEYSPYLTMVYGYETPSHYGKWKWQGKVTAWNNAFKKYVLSGRVVPYKKSNGELGEKTVEITDNNKEKRADAIAHGFKWDKLVAMAKADGAFLVDDNDDDE